jgi:chemotaxis protein MotB
MYRHRKRHLTIEHDNLDRWLVSYADYMTLLFALFVVLYALAIVKEESFESITDSIGRVFQADKEQPQNRGAGEGILEVNTNKPKASLYGDGLLAEPGPELMEGDKMLSNIKQKKLGASLETLEEGLNQALFELIEQGLAKLETDGDWLVIELSSGLLFPSGSASVTSVAEQILQQITEIIISSNNFLRIRGYTDNQPIENEIFSSNWELSVFRATAIVKLLERLEVNPARMAIEGYGQYYPSADNSTDQGRAQNRKVAIAISKYGLETSQEILESELVGEQNKALEEKLQNLSVDDNTIKVIPLDNGGVRITTRQDNSAQSSNN